VGTIINKVLKEKVYRDIHNILTFIIVKITIFK